MNRNSAKQFPIKCHYHTLIIVYEINYYPSHDIDVPWEQGM